LLGERTWGWPGHIIDILAVFATLFGLATSLGIGAQQISAGLSYLFGIPSTTTSHVFLIFGITIIALISVIRGLDGGVKRLSEINIALAFGFLIFVTLAGSTYVIITGVFSNTIHYLKLVPALNNWIGREDVAFLHDWTTFYWAWWIAWSPFVGMFIARISKGRSVREFLICVLIVPALLCIV
jgi:BCCT family betaine/carnitine transporter